MKLALTHLAGVSLLALTMAACSAPSGEDTTAYTLPETTDAPSRAGLAAGVFDAESVSWNVNLVANVPPPPGFFAEDTMFFVPDAWLNPPEEDAEEDEEEGGDAEETAGEDTVADEPVETAEADSEDDAEDTGLQIRPMHFANTDLAFSGDRVIMGNFHGFNIFDASEPAAPEVLVSVVCPGGQGDVSVHGNLVFHSVEQGRGRLDCGVDGVEEDSSAERFLGVRIFDISDVAAPVQIAAVQTCRGSHTHTLVPHPSDPNLVYVYVQGTNGVRPESELAGCTGGEPDENPDTALYSIDIIEVPLDAPETARVVNRPHIFADMETGEIAGLWAGGAAEEGAQSAAPTVACHDITVYPEMNLAAGACGGNGILLDISDPVNPQRISDLFDPNMAYWHSATFTNEADAVLFTDEWGGGIMPRCQEDDPENWGANIVATIGEDGALERRGFFKIPPEQTGVENCVAHNGTLIPVPGRDIMVQGWYSGGLSVTDFTDPDNIVEIAFFDRGPVDADTLYLAGYWAAYWHNGYIWAPEIVRGLDVLELVPNGHLTENEIAAANLIRFDEANTQTQLHFDWPAEPVVALAYLDQLTRTEALAADRLGQARDLLNAWSEGEADMADLVMMGTHFQALAADAEGADAERMQALGDLLVSLG
ncbi:LVIVD repeat-containing protein [Maricaulis parjimensis]|uniref:LVIVD repeat-containing protein n=1 Tax=Maricaulis parjimensis TaxID=144023 RepID=UPI00193A21EC|nr:hypothetical protein [Maricaulis parjimensis]